MTNEENHENVKINKEIIAVIELFCTIAYENMAANKNYVHALKLDKFKLGSLNDIDKDGYIRVSQKSLLDMFDHTAAIFESIKDGLHQCLMKAEALLGYKRI